MTTPAPRWARPLRKSRYSSRARTIFGAKTTNGIRKTIRTINDKCNHLAAERRQFHVPKVHGVGDETRQLDPQGKHQDSENGLGAAEKGQTARPVRDVRVAD